MKTFKLVGLKMIHQSSNIVKREDIPLIDGLIINKEDEHKNWLIEFMVDKKFMAFFQDKLDSHSNILVHATITKTTNDPATFSVTVRSITEMEQSLSVLLDANIVINKTKLAETVLTDLINQGLEGESLLNEFKHKLEVLKS